MTEQPASRLLVALVALAIMGAGSALSVDNQPPAPGTCGEMKVPMRDGVRLATTVCIPVGDGPWPTVLHRTPYGRSPSYWSRYEKHGMALAMRHYGLASQAGFCVIAGEIGFGKASLIRYRLKQVGEDVSVGLITNIHSSFGELVVWVLLAFDLDFKGRNKVERHQVIVDFLINEYAQTTSAVLIINEAQNLKPHTLEELRKLSNIDGDKDQVSSSGEEQFLLILTMSWWRRILLKENFWCMIGTAISEGKLTWRSITV